MLSEERKEKEAANSTSPATTDEEPVVLRTKVTVQPVSYGTDSSSTEGTYNVKKFEDSFPDPPKVPKSVGGAKVKKSFSSNRPGTSKESKTEVENTQSSEGATAVKECVTGHSDDGENPSSELFHSSPQLSDSKDVTFPLSGFVTTQSNDIVHLKFCKLNELETSKLWLKYFFAEKRDTQPTKNKTPKISDDPMATTEYSTTPQTADEEPKKKQLWPSENLKMEQA